MYYFEKHLEIVLCKINKAIDLIGKLQNLLPRLALITLYKAFVPLHKKIKFFIKDFFRKCNQIRRFLRIWSHLLKKSSMENFHFLSSVHLMVIFLMIKPAMHCLIRNQSLFNTVRVQLLLKQYVGSSRKKLYQELGFEYL